MGPGWQRAQPGFISRRAHSMWLRTGVCPRLLVARNRPLHDDPIKILEPWRLGAKDPRRLALDEFLDKLAWLTR